MTWGAPEPRISGRADAHPLDAAQGIWKVITASSVGTMIEWYDFYIFGSLAAIIATQFFPGGNPTAAFLKTLATFAVGFAVRPLGALVFGRIGDLTGRKFAFLATLLIMGGSTAAIGFLPGYSRIGIAAPIILVVLRLLQGLALGGEYGGAAVYVAEHAPDGRRGFYTSFIQTTATLGLFLSLAVILIVRAAVGEDAFKVWGWRIPFVISLLLVAISYYIRMRLRESPLFTALKESGQTSQAPIQESFGTWSRWKIFLTVLFGATAGQAVVWYTGQFYALLFLQTVLKVPLVTSYVCVAVALILGAPLFVFFGSLSDRIGRKKIMMTGKSSRRAALRSHLPRHEVLFEPGERRRAYRARVRPGRVRDDGVRSHCRVSGRGFSGEDSVYIDVAAVSLRQWMVRRISSDHRNEPRRADGEHICRPRVSDRRRADHGRRRLPLAA